MNKKKKIISYKLVPNLEIQLEKKCSIMKQSRWEKRYQKLQQIMKVIRKKLQWWICFSRESAMLVLQHLCMKLLTKDAQLTVVRTANRIRTMKTKNTFLLNHLRGVEEKGSATQTCQSSIKNLKKKIFVKMLWNLFRLYAMGYLRAQRNIKFLIQQNKLISTVVSKDGNSVLKIQNKKKKSFDFVMTQTKLYKENYTTEFSCIN